jgi:O-antigen/teichoic acid export membrane protein
MIRGIIWNATERFGSVCTSFIVTIFLARILKPEDFGIIGMLSVFVGFGNLLIESGFKDAIIREKSLDKKSLSSIFFLNITIGILIYIGLYILSPVIAVFFSIPELEQISKIIFLIFIINSLAVVQNSLLIKCLRFKEISLIGLISSIISGIIGISHALLYNNVWGLVIQMLCYAFVRFILIWIVGNWTPQFSFSFSPIKHLLAFSAKMLFIKGLTVLFENIYTVIIGRYYTKTEVGFYNQAKRLRDLPNTCFNWVLQNVSYPIIVKINNDEKDIKPAYQKIFNTAFYFNTALMFFLFMASDSIVTIVYGKNWLPCSMIFKILCIEGILYPLQAISINIFKAKSEDKKLVYIDMVRRLLAIVGIFFTVSISIKALLIGAIVSAILSVLISMQYSGKLIGFSLQDQLYEILPILCIATVSSVLAFFTSTFFQNIYMNFMCQFLVYSIIYILLSYIAKISIITDLLSIIKKT